MPTGSFNPGLRAAPHALGGPAAPPRLARGRADHGGGGVLGAKKLHHYCIKWKWISGISRLSDYRVFSSRLSDYLFFLQIIEYLRVNIENL